MEARLSVGPSPPGSGSKLDSVWLKRADQMLEQVDILVILNLNEPGLKSRENVSGSLLVDSRAMQSNATSITIM